MTEITVHFHTDQNQIDPNFFEELRLLAEPYGLHVAKKQHKMDSLPRKRKLSHEEFVHQEDEIRHHSGSQSLDSTDLIRADRNERNQRDAERAASSGGLRKDLSHLDPYRG
ncbi:MAG: hypothetical protein C4527_19970 [Candidatus Omnitrophota bacterium]|jgi:hypothetical protein|nr:MAG: hypothetical protein C4527_19970 [Candidatus Omnitrophota bacterium]